jgi:hypothetical protein
VASFALHPWTEKDHFTVRRLVEARSRLAALTLKEQGAANPYISRTSLDSLREEVEELEAELSSRSAEFRNSMGAVFTRLPDAATVRRELFRIALALKKMGVTAVLTAECPENYRDYQFR